MLGLHVTDDALEQFFVSLPCLECWWTNGGGVLYQFDRNNISVVLAHRHIGSVTICSTVYYCRFFSPIFWPMLLTFRRCTFCCIRDRWTKHPGYPLQERLYDFIDCCLYNVYMYQWQNQHALSLMPGWILVPSDPWRWQEKLLCSVVTA